MQGVLTFLTMACAATFQFAVAPGLLPNGRWCFTGTLTQQPSLEQRLSDAGVPELSEAFGMEVAETPEVLRHSFHSEPPGTPVY